MEDLDVLLTGSITWVLTPKKKNKKIIPGLIFRALGKFTSDWDPAFTVVVNYSSSPLWEGETYPVRLAFPLADRSHILQLCKNSEVVILDGPKVLAICHDLEQNLLENKKMGSPWE